MSRAELLVDLGAIRHNVRRLREIAGPGVAMMTVVKADGYGHGMVPVARAAREAGADWLGVATLDEAVALRACGDTGPVLCWLTVPGEDYRPAVAAGIDITAYTLGEVAEIISAGVAVDAVPRVQLKVDTGLSRGGAGLAAWPEFVRAAAEAERAGRLRLTGVWSHLATADDPDHPALALQEKRFADAVAIAREAGLRPEVVHLANSAGTVLTPSTRYDLVRCGIATYGLDPAPGVTEGLDLRPAMTARADLALVKRLAAGEGVSYGHTWVAERDTVVGLVPVGYGEGVLRAAGNRVNVWIGGAERPIRGRVCMDQFVVDLGPDGLDADGRPIAPGADVVLFGPPTNRRPGPTAQDWAAALETINYEIVTRIGGRFTRRYLDTDGSTGR